MAKANKITKHDMARWLAIFPATVLAIIFYALVVDEWLYKIFLMYFDGENDGHLFSNFNAFMFALIISLGGYFMSPRFKFKSTLLTISTFSIFFAFFLINNPYVRERVSSLIIIYLITAILCLYIIYKKEGK
jgi:hypothetical protein